MFGMGWNCVEGNPKYYEKIHRLRSCSLLPTCVGNEDGETVRFILHSDSNTKNKDSHWWFSDVERKINLRCTTVDHALRRRYSVHRVIDFMNVNVDGDELLVLLGINWRTTKINVTNIRVMPGTKLPIKQFLHGIRYKELKNLANGQPVSGTVYRDNVFLAQDVIFGKPE